MIWALLLLIGIFGGLRLDYGGHHFEFAILVAAILMAGEVFLAAPRIRERLASSSVAWALPLVPLAAYLIYSIVGYPLAWKYVLFGAVYVLLPALLAWSARGRVPGAWQDYAAVLLIWLPVELGNPLGSHLLYKLWPYPPPLTHALTILLALNTAVAAFLFVRRLDGVGYAVEWRRGFGWAVGFHFAVIALIIIPLGEKISFIHFAASLERLKSVPLMGLGILVFTAWPEEFLFRGLLQNLFSRSMRNPYAGWIVASVVFGFSHILHAPIPNWKYVFLATIAGFIYGRAWMKTGSLVPSCIIHALVDTTWFALFP